MLRNKLRYLIFLALVGLLTILYNEYYISVIFLTILLIPFFLFGLLCYYYGKIKAEIVPIIYMANKGDRIPVSIVFDNPTIFPIAFVKIYITYKNAYSSQVFKKTINASLDNRTKTSVIFNLTSQFSGNMEITLEGIRFYDYIKLFSLKKKQKGGIRIAVLPSYHELEDDEIIKRNNNFIESDNYSPVKKGDDPSEVFEIRDYREGDRIQRVHWKLSSKYDQLMIKEFSDPVNCSILIFVNMYVPETENTLYYMDAILECALTLSNTLLSKGHMHYVSWYDIKQGICQRVCVNTESDLYEAINGMLQAQPYIDELDTISAYMAEYTHDSYSDLIMITGEVFTPMIDSLSRLKAYSKQLLYMKDIKNTLENQALVTDLVLKSKNIGVDLRPVDIRNIRRDIVQSGAL